LLEKINEGLEMKGVEVLTTQRQLRDEIVGKTQRKVDLVSKVKKVK
jgi:hypothetical protein